jgi:hypothetical protein
VEKKMISILEMEEQINSYVGEEKIQLQTIMQLREI